MFGIGIDTGGTCTDAVIFDTKTHEVLSQSKTETTRPDLRIGIIKALSGLDRSLIEKADYLALSTTLATNACVEGKGGRAKLVFIGVQKNLVEKMRGEYGLPPMDEIYFMDGDPKNLNGPEPDWEEFAQDVAGTSSSAPFANYDSVAIVQMNPKYNDGEYELQAETIIKEKLGIPCVRGYELYQELNVQKRGATALLNARLLTVMESFFHAIDESLKDLGIDKPIVIVRSDGTIMSREFAMSRPVETLLCGPAASIIGAMELSKYQDALIVDMGGTTSDVAMVKDGIPVEAESGISIGEWKTMVKGVSIDTFALGGDTAVKYRNRNLYLDQRRYIPLCLLASQYPEVVRKLKTLVHMDQSFAYPAHEFFVLMHMPENLASYTPSEQRFIKGLAGGPLIYKDAADAARISPHVLKMQRLEDEGIVMRAGLTPTDIMHALGDYVEYDADASKLGATYLATVTKTDADVVCKEVYDLVKCRLYSNLVRIFMQYETGRELNPTEREELEKLTTYIYRHQGKERAKCHLIPKFTAPSKLIGIGAPTKIFLADVAELLGTEADFPKDGKVANAIGAAMGNISTECTIRIEPYKGIKSTYLTYVISGGPKTFSLPEYEEAVAEGKKIARACAIERARQQGATGEIEVKLNVTENKYKRNWHSIEELVETIIVAEAKTGGTYAD